MGKVKFSLITGMAMGLLAGSAIGVGAQEGEGDPTAPMLVTGTVLYAPSCSSPTPDLEGGAHREYGYRCEPQTWQSDDPRLEGKATVTWNSDVHDVDGLDYSVIAMAWEVRGENGGWLCDTPNALDKGRGLFTSSLQGTDRLTCSGTGINDGLSAILIADWSTEPKTLEGLIFPGELPPLPDPTAE